jgi:hypothetical protein
MQQKAVWNAENLGNLLRRYHHGLVDVHIFRIIGRIVAVVAAHHPRSLRNKHCNQVGLVKSMVKPEKKRFHGVIHDVMVRRQWWGSNISLKVLATWPFHRFQVFLETTVISSELFRRGGSNLLLALAQEKHGRTIFQEEEILGSRPSQDGGQDWGYNALEGSGRFHWLASPK